MTSRVEPKHLDLATLEYIHNEWEFEDRTEAEFDDWLHELIKAARERQRRRLRFPRNKNERKA